MTTANDTLARQLILDERFDLTLYEALYKISSGTTKKILGELIPVETEHLAFWQKFFNIKIDRLDFKRRVKLRLLVGACRLFGPTAFHLILEAIEVYGIKKYLAVWNLYKNEPLGEAVRKILDDEFNHEDSIVSQATERKITPETVKSIFLGFNDGLVEILGAVSGFFAAFHSTGPVLMASLSVATAGSISMAAGAYVASSSEQEVHKIDREKKRFYSGGEPGEDNGAHPLMTASIVGTSYFIGAMCPVLPVLFGATTVWASVATACTMIIFLSTVLAFLSGMDMKKRIGMNLVIIAGAVGISYVIGMGVKQIWGISI